MEASQQNTHGFEYYKHSGKFAPQALVIVPVMGILSALILGVVYGFLIFYCPFIYINFFITLLFGGGVGLAVSVAVMWGKVRNLMLAGMFGLGAGALALYVSWVAWFYAGSKGEILIVDPAGLWRGIQHVAANGAWELFGWQPVGFALYGIWAIEAAMVVGLAVMVALQKVSEIPFCEKSNNWLTEAEIVTPLGQINDPDELRRSMENLDFLQLVDLNKATDENNFTRVEFRQSQHNPEFCLISVVQVTRAEDDEGKIETNENYVIRNFILTQEVYNTLKNAWNESEVISA